MQKMVATGLHERNNQTDMGKVISTVLHLGNRVSYTVPLN